MGTKIKAILIDVDDCLLPTNGAVSISFFDSLWHISGWIKAANEGKFPQIGFCSGRDRNYIEAVSSFVGLPNSWSIIESGVALFNPATKELIFHPDLTIEVQDAFKEISRKKVPQILRAYPEIFLYPGNLVQVTFERRHGSDLSIKDAYETVKEEFSDLISSGLVTVRHSSIAVDITPAGIDKAPGVTFFAQNTGVNPKQILGIGDSRGDFPMFKMVGHVGCPANASEECKTFVKERDGYVSSHSYSAGVGDVISCLTAITLPPSSPKPKRIKAN